MRPHVVSWLGSVLPGEVAAALAPSWFTCVGLAGGRHVVLDARDRAA